MAGKCGIPPVCPVFKGGNRHRASWIMRLAISVLWVWLKSSASMIRWKSNGRWFLTSTFSLYMQHVYTEKCNSTCLCEHKHMNICMNNDVHFMHIHTGGNSVGKIMQLGNSEIVKQMSWNIVQSSGLWMWRPVSRLLAGSLKYCGCVLAPGSQYSPLKLKWNGLKTW